MDSCVEKKSCFLRYLVLRLFLRGVRPNKSWSFSDIGFEMEAPGDLRSKLMGQQVSLNLEQTNNIFQNPQSDWAVLKTVLFYSVLILVLPIGSFFATKSLLFEWFLGQVILNHM